MGVYKIINHDQLGEIYCKTDEEEIPICWAKQTEISTRNDRWLYRRNWIGYN